MSEGDRSRRGVLPEVDVDEVELLGLLIVGGESDEHCHVRERRLGVERRDGDGVWVVVVVGRAANGFLAVVDASSAGVASWVRPSRARKYQPLDSA